MKTLSNILILTALAAVAANADITVTLDNASQIGAPGAVLNFFGMIANNGDSTVYLNGDSFNFALGPASYTINDNFFTNVPISLAAGANSGDIDLFDVTLSNPIVDPNGSYSGSYGLLGGIDGNAQDNLGAAVFSVTTITPEPSFLVILAAAMIILTTIRVRGHRLTS
ncbi:MAG TPA: hypothetical protein VHY84_24565 [Bryobacteraceae bacterium]|jgi:hypothetical protein|nr:hypothetical protein [Bryobacteraceae bacterium]